MMLDYDAYQAGSAGIKESRRAKHAWKRINRWPTSIVIARGADDLDAQIVRVELNSTSGSTTEIESPSGDSGKLSAIVFGVRNHPDEDVLDTDIQRDDRFFAEDQWHRVIDVIVKPGEVQALCEVVS